MRLLGRLFTAIFVASLVLPAAIAGPALAAGDVIVFPGSPFADATAGADTIITVEVDNGVVIDPGYTGTVTLATGDGSDIVTPVSHLYGAPESGTFDFTVTFGAAGPRTLSATDDQGDTAASGTITVVPGAADHLAFTTQPGSAVAGAPFAPQPVVQIEDSEDNPVPGAGVAIDVAIGTNPTAGTLSGITTENTDINGVATFDGLSIDAVGVGYTLTASSSGVTDATSSPFDITVGAAHHLQWITPPSDSDAATAFGAQPVVQIRDVEGNLVTTATDAVTLSITGAPAGAHLTCSNSGNPVNASGGIATFDGCQIDKAGTYTLTASDGVPDAVSASFTIAVGAADHLAFTTQPGGGTATLAWTFQPVVQVQDAGNNPVTGAGVSIVVAIGTNPSTGTLAGTKTLPTASNGSATFAGLSINKSGTGYTLTAASSGPLLGTSAAFDIAPGVATHLTFTTQPVGASGGLALATQPIIEVRDAGENLVPGAQTMIIAIGTNPGGTLSGTTSITTSGAGIGTFTDLSVDKAHPGYTLIASILTGSITGTSNAFSIAIGPAAHLTFTTQPVGSTGGLALATQPMVEVRDAGDNLVPGAQAMTIAFGANPGGGSLSGTTSITTTAGGIGTFTNLSVARAATGYTLIASITGPVTGTSAAFDVAVGPATHLFFAQQPSTTRQGVPISPSISVQVLDAGGNIVTTDTSPVTLAFGNNAGSGTLAGTNPRSAVAGVATFSDISVNLAGTGYTLTAVNGLPLITSGSFDITLQPNNAPAGLDHAVATNEDTTYAFAASDFGFSDTLDVPQNGFVAVTITTLPTAGTLLDNGAVVAAGASIPIADINGSHLTFSPAANANGSGYATFTFQVQDSGGSSGTGDLDPTPNTLTVSVVAVDDAPVAVNDGVVVVKQGQSLTTSAATGVLVNDNDIDSPAASLTAVVEVGPQHGSLTLNSNGSYSYTPTPSYLGSDSFTYRAFDGTLVSNVATVSISVYINHPPIAASDIRWVISGSPATALHVLDNDYQFNPDPGETLVISAVGHATHGKATIVAGGTDLSYKPTSTFSGTDIFTYTVTDGQFSTSTSVLVHVPKDKVKPTTTAPVQTITGQTVGAKTVVVHLTWSGADVGSGVAKYQLQQKKNSGSYATVKLSSAAARSINRTLSVGASYQFRVRAVDKRGNTGAWTYGPKFKVVVLQETSASFAGSWILRTGSSYSGKKERTTSVAGSSATFTTTGRTFAWFGVRGKTRGTAQVFVDGVLAQNVNLTLSSTRYRYVAFSRTFAASGVHTIRIVFSDVSTRLIDVDGFIVLR